MPLGLAPRRGHGCHIEEVTGDARSAPCFVVAIWGGGLFVVLVWAETCEYLDAKEAGIVIVNNLLALHVHPLWPSPICPLKNGLLISFILAADPYRNL